jgi:hypothetical protein
MKPADKTKNTNPFAASAALRIARATRSGQMARSTFQVIQKST